MFEDNAALDAELVEMESGAGVLARTEAWLARFVAYPSEHARVAHTLWIAHTHLMDCWESTPRCAFLSPERGSGKTRALEVTEPLVPSPVHAVNCTPAYLFRKIGDDEAGRPTILYDEVDNLFKSKVEGSGEVLAVLNAGHRRGAVAGRCVMVGKKVETEELPAYCAVAIAGLGNLPDTIGSRSIIIDMRRRAPDEAVAPFRSRIDKPQGALIGRALASWCSDASDLIAGARPDLPPGVEDRDADVWEPLLAIADAAGEDWPERARAAATTLVAGAVDRTRTSGVQLLADLHEVFGGAEKLATETILNALHALPESAWIDVRGKPLNDRGLATRLRRYGVKPTQLRIDGEKTRGYYAADLQDAWRRYLPSPGNGGTSGTPVHGAQSGTPETAENRGKSDFRTAVPDVPVFQGTGADVPDEEADRVDREEAEAMRLDRAGLLGGA